METSSVSFDFIDRLSVEGVCFKGFGIIPKYIMNDTDLSIEAKGIYAYFCTYAGRGNCAFPSREKILKDLKIGKTAYYNHLPKLVDSGYITIKSVKSNRGCFSNNHYSIVSNPKKLQNNPIPLKNKSTESAIMSTGIKADGFGIIPKAVMIDTRLNLKAKSLYAYFAALLGNGETSFPKRDVTTYILGINVDTYTKCLKELVSTNYITTVQRRLESGKLGINDYYLNDTPNTSSLLEQQTNISESITPPCRKKPDTVKPYTAEPYTVNKDTINNSPKINNSINNNLINQSNNKKKGAIDCLNLKEFVIELKNNLEYNLLVEGNYWKREKKLLDDIINIMAIVIATPSANYKINGATIPGEHVSSKLKEINIDHISYVVDSIKSMAAAGGTITNIKSYIITSLFNATMTMNIDIAAKSQKNMYD